MSHELQFSDSVRPARVRILKLALLDYSLGHEALLLNQRNAFLLCSAKQISEMPMEQAIFALKSGVLICSQTWSENHRPQKWIRLWGWLTRNENWPLAIAEFQNYISAGRALPKAPSKFACEVLYGKDDDKGRAMGSPLLAQFYLWATRPENKEMFPIGWDASFAMAGTLYFAQLEMEGRARIENSAESEEQTEMDKIQSEVAAEEAKGTQSKFAGGLASLPPDLT